MKLKSLVVLLLFSLNCYPQGKVVDYKLKTSANEKERTQMLDALRVELKKQWKLEFIFTVNYFKANDTYAWLQASAERKDGKAMTFPDDAYDCCHVECLFKKQDGKWLVLRKGAFSTDVWFDGLEKKYPGAAKLIFPEGRVYQ